jgi:hypothetical protein
LKATIVKIGIFISATKLRLDNVLVMFYKLCLGIALGQVVMCVIAGADWIISACTSTQKRLQPSRKQREILHLTFPHYQSAPTLVLQRLDRPSVPRPVPEEFGSPKGPPRFRERRFSTIGMLVPKTPVNENSLLSGRKDKVRTARQIATMQAKSVSEGMRKTPNYSLRLRVLSANACHKPTAFRGNRELSFLCGARCATSFQRRRHFQS